MNACSYLDCCDNPELKLNCLFPSSSFLKERQIKVLWEFVYRSVKALIVRAGRRDTNKYPQVTYHPVLVMFSLYWNVRVERTTMSHENSVLLLLFVLTPQYVCPHCCTSRSSSVIHLVLWLLEQWSHIEEHIETCQTNRRVTIIIQWWRYTEAL